jgi:hypothetical protein
VDHFGAAKWISFIAPLKAYDMYGRKQKARVVDMVARWHNVPERSLRVVAVEPLSGGRGKQAFYSTLLQDSAEQVLMLPKERGASRCCALRDRGRRRRPGRARARC